MNTVKRNDVNRRGR